MAPNRYKPKVILLFGGCSTEHEVSLVSARNVYEALISREFEVVPIGITKSGKWLEGDEICAALIDGKPLPDHDQQAVLLPLPAAPALTLLHNDKATAALPRREEQPVVLFPVLHGRYGEDGALQGLCEMAQIPYVGSGVLGSALGMDKIAQKKIAAFHGIPVPRFTSFSRARILESIPTVMTEIDTFFSASYPLFVKPANTGSSVGVVKVKDRSEVAAALIQAAALDMSIIVEEAIKQPREIEVSLLGNDSVRASRCGEIIPKAEFYDYEAKYHSTATEIIIPAAISAELESRVQELGATIFNALNLRGLARADFLLSGTEIFFNEVNTMPGFTNVSMYPKLWEASGVSYGELVETLVDLALSEWQEKRKLKGTL